MNDELLNTTEAAKVIGLPIRTFYDHKREFDCCLAPRPIGQRKYVKSKLEQWKAAGTPSRFGKSA
jgi:hypothetical protein